MTQPGPGAPPPANPGGSATRLAVLIFLATLLANLLSVAAELSSATGLILPLLATLDPAPTLRVVGSDTVLGDDLRMAAQWRSGSPTEGESDGGFLALAGNTWNQSVPLIGSVKRQVEVTIQPVGTLKAIEQAQLAQVDLLAASEPLADTAVMALESKNLKLRCAAEIGYDIISFVTDMNQKNLKPIALEQFRKILLGEVKDWAEVGADPQPIRVLVRKGSGTTQHVLQSLLGSGEWRPHFIECPSNKACLDLVLSTPGSLYWVSTAWLFTQPSNFLRPTLIRHTAVAAANPLRADFDPAQYPPQLIRPLYLYAFSGSGIDPRAADKAEQFLRYVRGVSGQDILSKNHFFTYFAPPGGPGAVPVDLPTGFGPQLEGPPVVCK